MVKSNVKQHSDISIIIIIINFMYMSQKNLQKFVFINIV